MSFIDAEVAPVTSTPESVGEEISIPSKLPAAKFPPIAIPVSAPVIAPLEKEAVPLSRVYSPKSLGSFPTRATKSRRSW